MDYLSTCKFKWCLLFVALFCFFLLLGRIRVGRVHFSWAARWARGEREGPYPRGGVGYLWLAHPFRLATRALP
jgi:hypothetical protein